MFAARPDMPLCAPKLSDSFSTDAVAEQPMVSMTGRLSADRELGTQHVTAARELASVRPRSAPATRRA